MAGPPPPPPPELRLPTDDVNPAHLIGYLRAQIRVDLLRSMRMAQENGDYRLAESIWHTIEEFTV